MVHPFSAVPTAFAVQPAGFLGTAGRNILRGPGLATLDLSISKNTPLRALGDSGKLEFRAEIFNVFNHINLGNPAVGIDNPATVARITSMNGSTRQLQLGIRLTY